MMKIFEAIKKYGSAFAVWLVAAVEGALVEPALGAVIVAAWGLVMAVSKWLAPDADKVLAVKEAKAEAKKH